MKVSTYKQKKGEGLKSSPVSEKKKTQKKKKPTTKMYLPQCPTESDIHCIIEYKGKKEKVKLTKGIIEVETKEEVDKLLFCGFALVTEKKKKYGKYFSDEFKNDSFALLLDDLTKIPLKKGFCTPKNDYQIHQLKKRNFVFVGNTNDK
jgi:hypothetical protein